MRTIARLLLRAAVLIACSAVCAAEIGGTAGAPHEFSKPELERLLAPIALYPDTLLSLVLMGASYPAEVTEAARWSKENPRAHGEAAVRAAMRQPWDTSVITLTAFPPLLAQMNESMDWTRRLGQAYLAGEAAVLDVIQGLRQKAY